MLIATLSPAAFATNGQQLIGIGPTSRSMGGVGIAAPQDAISAVFSNPSAMCFGPYCPSSQFDFAGTIFMPEPKAEITASGQTIKADARDQNYAIPAIGFSVPIGGADARWRFGLSAYGVSGLGVDYRDTNLDRPDYFFPGTPFESPLAAGTYTNLQLMKFAPTIAYQALPNLSVGTSFQINYSTLDLGDGTVAAYSYGVKLGVSYKPLDQLTLGLVYTSPQKATYNKVYDFNNNGNEQNLTLEQPQEVGLGVAYEFLKPRLLLETNVKWINWSDAEGYEDFDWNNQWVFAVGAQWEAIDHLFFRVGYNYAENPVDDHDNWDGSFATFDTVSVQGKSLPRYYYESFRVVGFPAIVEHHITAGVGYELGENLVLNLSYMHAFENELSENGTAPDGSSANLKSKLSEDSLDFAFTWRF